MDGRKKIFVDFVHKVWGTLVVKQQETSCSNLNVPKIGSMAACLIVVVGVLGWVRRALSCFDRKKAFGHNFVLTQWTCGIRTKQEMEKITY